MTQATSTSIAGREIRAASDEPLGAIDLGSNAIRLLIGTVDSRRRIDPICRVREPVRLGHDVFDRGRIRPETTRQVGEALRRFRKLARKHDAERIRAVGTSAVREARNRQEFIDEVSDISGLDVEVIDGHEEAHLIHLAVAQRLKLAGRTALLVDIGGGSVELALSAGAVPVAVESFELGTLRVLRSLERGRWDPSDVDRRVRGFLRQALKLAGKQHVDLCVGTGGNIECLGELGVELLGKACRMTLATGELDRLSHVLTNMTLAARVRYLKLRPDRADVIVPATLVLQSVLRNAAAERLLIPNVSLRHGLLLDLARGDVKPKSA